MKKRLDIFHLFDVKALIKMDWLLLVCVISIMIVGFYNLDSISAATGNTFQWKQLRWYCAGLFLVFIITCFDYRKLSSSFFSYFLYSATILLLAVVLVWGREIHGSKRWLFFFQPSELAKISIIILTASYLFHYSKTSYSIKDLWKPILLLLIPAALVKAQPDLGTAVIFFLIAGSMFLFAGIEWKSFIFFLFSAASLFAVVIMKNQIFFSSYQMSRILAFLNPADHASSLAYQTNQSVIAVGSGMLLGKGYKEGTQTHLSFLPEVETDFAFAVWAEETGFVGAIILTCLFLFFFYRCCKIISETKDRFGLFLAFGSTVMIFWQWLINALMVLGWSPVVGLTYPLISYGGSSALVTCVSIGLLLSVSARRKMYYFK